MKKTVLKILGANCKRFRIEVLNKTQKDIANELGYSKETISSFETGRNDNCEVFLYYIKNGILEYYSIEELLGWYE